MSLLSIESADELMHWCVENLTFSPEMRRVDIGNISDLVITLIESGNILSHFRKAYAARVVFLDENHGRTL